MSEKVQAALGKLKPKYRNALYLYYYQELSREEVAATGFPRKVSELVNYALKLLRKEIKT